MRSEWIEIGSLEDIPQRGSRIVQSAEGPVAIFRNGEDHIFALYDQCPHRGGPLSQGIVHGASVTCPLHNWVISLETGEAEGPDHGCTGRIAVELRDGRVWLALSQQARRAHG